jgi:hypothetical protein
VYSEEIYDAEVCTPPVLLKKCQLGTDCIPDFCTTIDLPEPNSHLHFYFVADMGAGLKLSSKIGDEMTHWRNSFCPNTLNKKQATINYSSEVNDISITWK